jgi:hypothetical protein
MLLLGDDGAEVAVRGSVALLVDFEKRVEVFEQTLPQRRGLGSAGTIGLCNHSALL